MKRLFRAKINAAIGLLGMMAVLFSFATPLYAANKTVTISEVTATTTEVTVKGTTDAEAVIVQLRDATGDNILAMKSLAVVDGAFSDSLTDLSLEEETDYTVYMADYEGGDFTTETFRIEAEEEDDEETEEDNEEEENDVDAGDMKQIIVLSMMFVVSALGAVAMPIVRKKARR